MECGYNGRSIGFRSCEAQKFINEIQTFLEPVFDAIVSEDEWQKRWSFIMKWNKNESVSNGIKGE